VLLLRAYPIYASKAGLCEGCEELQIPVSEDIGLYDHLVDGMGCHI
jgi:hypothetical protein